MSGQKLSEAPVRDKIICLSIDNFFEFLLFYGCHLWHKFLVDINTKVRSSAVSIVDFNEVNRQETV